MAQFDPLAALIGAFVAMVIICMIAWLWLDDEYERAQYLVRCSHHQPYNICEHNAFAIYPEDK